jgi:preprotein translocase subunit SecY
MADNALARIFRVKELRQRVLFTLGMLLVFRIGAVLPIPGIDVQALNSYFLTQTGQSGGVGLTDYLDFFAGGAFKNFSVFMLGIMPYISMSIIMQLLLLVFPSLKRISEGDGGRKKIQKYIRYGTVLVCLIQSFTVTQYARTIPDIINSSLLGWKFNVIAILTVTVGTLFLMWIGEQINEKGVGNGISLIIFTGIVARMPGAVSELIREIGMGNINPVFVILAFMMFVGVVILVIYEQQGQRKIPVHYAKRIVGRKVYGAQNAYIPLKINPSGVIPVIFASSILTLPLTVASMLGPSRSGWANFASFLRPNGPAYLIIYTLLIVFFAYFYTQVSLNPIEIARQIRENGGSIPGIRSENMEAYLTKVLNRIVLPGSLFLALIALIPSLVVIVFSFPTSISYLMGGTSLLILVGVDLDTMSQIEGHLKMHHHDGLVKGGKLKSRNL